MRRGFERILAVAGLFCLVMFAASYFKFEAFQRRAFISKPKHFLTPVISTPQSDAHAVMAIIFIPRLAMRVAVVEGDDDESLALAAGHMPGTALPGRPGNVVIAGHRDSAFWPLRGIRTGDRIEITAAKTSVYLVQRTQVVEANDVRSLADTAQPMLTLVTCYPFRHVGPAPQRFVVRAKLKDEF